MLVLSRKPGQTIIIDDNVRVTVVSIRGSQIRLGIEAPPSVKVFREELCTADRANKDTCTPRLVLPKRHIRDRNSRTHVLASPEAFLRAGGEPLPHGLEREKQSHARQHLDRP